MFYGGPGATLRFGKCCLVVYGTRIVGMLGLSACVVSGMFTKKTPTRRGNVAECSVSLPACVVSSRENRFRNIRLTGVCCDWSDYQVYRMVRGAAAQFSSGCSDAVWHVEACVCGGFLVPGAADRHELGLHACSLGGGGRRGGLPAWSLVSWRGARRVAEVGPRQPRFATCALVAYICSQSLTYAHVCSHLMRPGRSPVTRRGASHVSTCEHMWDTGANAASAFDLLGDRPSN